MGIGIGTELTFKRLVKWGLSASVVALFFATSAVQAATLNVSGGQLIGASGVDVGGTLYNVDFVEGTCLALFSGCDSASDFDFSDAASAALASQALIDQVFIDSGAGPFDSAPDLTFGCSSPVSCLAVTPYSPFSATVFNAQAAANNLTVQPDFARGSRLRLDYDSATDIKAVFAVWSVVPEPHSALLIAMGLAGLGCRRRGLA